MRRSITDPDVQDVDELGEEITRLVDSANENGIPSEDIKGVLESHVNYADSQLESSWDMAEDA